MTADDTGTHAGRSAHCKLIRGCPARSCLPLSRSRVTATVVRPQSNASRATWLSCPRGRHGLRHPSNQTPQCVKQPTDKRSRVYFCYSCNAVGPHRLAGLAAWRASLPRSDLREHFVGVWPAQTGFACHHVEREIGVQPSAKECQAFLGGFRLAFRCTKDGPLTHKHARPS